MQLTKEDFERIQNAFGPCTNYYECIDYKEAAKQALKFTSLKDYVKSCLQIEDILMDRYKSANADSGEWIQEDIDECHEFEESYTIRVKELLNEMV